MYMYVCVYIYIYIYIQIGISLKHSIGSEWLLKILFCYKKLKCSSVNIFSGRKEKTSKKKKKPNKTKTGKIQQGLNLFYVY